MSSSMGSDDGAAKNPSNGTGANQFSNGDLKLTSSEAASKDAAAVADLTGFVREMVDQMQSRFSAMSDQVLGRIDDMSGRIDDLEKNIADLMTQAGVPEDEPGHPNNTAAAPTAEST